MKEDSVRTTIDIPAPLYRKLKQQPAATGKSVRELVLIGVRATVLEPRRTSSKRSNFL
jgi:hypothetical protein